MKRDDAPSDAAQHPAAASASGTRAGRLTRQRVLSLAADIGSVVFAVLVALTIDQWWESRENAELGRRGLDAIVAELQVNLETLEDGAAQIDRVLASTDSALALMRTGVKDVNVNINYPVALLSSAAWQTAQTTRAVHFMDLDDVIRIARIYDLQQFLLRNQERLTDLIADIGSLIDDDPLKVVDDVRRRYRVVSGFRGTLANAYRCLLAELHETAPEGVTDCAAYMKS